MHATATPPRSPSTSRSLRTKAPTRGRFRRFLDAVAGRRSPSPASPPPKGKLGHPGSLPPQLLPPTPPSQVVLRERESARLELGELAERREEMRLETSHRAREDAAGPPPPALDLAGMGAITPPPSSATAAPARLADPSVDLADLAARLLRSVRVGGRGGRRAVHLTLGEGSEFAGIEVRLERSAAGELRAAIRCDDPFGEPQRLARALGAAFAARGLEAEIEVD